MVISEENLLGELRKGNARALEFIMDTYSNLVFSVVINVLGIDNREYALECMNDIFLIVWNKNSLYDPEKASLKNWILAVSKYKAIDYKRALKNQGNVELEEEILFSAVNVENEYIAKENMDELLKLLDRQNKVDKEIFIMKYILDEDIATISEKVTLSKGAVYNRLWRMRNFLMDKLGITYNKEEAK